MPYLIQISFRFKWWYFYGSTIFIYRDHGEVAGIGMPPLTRPDVLCFDPDSNFHLGAADKVDTAPQGHQFADVDRLTEHHLID